MNLKIRFPTGYQINDYFNDNIDLHVILENEKVFFATIFTVENIQYLMSKSQDSYFWATDMFIVKDLKKETIRTAVLKSIDDMCFESIFCYLGTIDKIYGENQCFEDFG